MSSMNAFFTHICTRGTFPSQQITPSPPLDVINGVDEQEVDEIVASQE
jgi:hypothetical protein